VPFNRHSTLRELLADEKARELLEKHVPGASTHPDLPMAMDMSLADAASYPEAGVSREQLDALVLELERLP
jgi:hypothetical protein